MGCSISVEVPVATAPRSAASAAPTPSAAPTCCLVLINGDLDDVEILRGAVLPQHIVHVYDHKKDTMDAIASAVEATGKVFPSIAVFSHGQAGSIMLLGSQSITAKNLREPAVADFWKRLARRLTPGGRIDILGCSVAGGADGAALITGLETLTGVNFAASTDKTSSAGGGTDTVGSDGDMFLETDGINALELYFDAIKIKEYKHSLFVFCLTAAGVMAGCAAVASAQSVGLLPRY